MSLKTIQSLQRGLQIIKILRQSPEGLGLNELAHRLGVSSSATHHLVNTLVQENFCKRLEKPIRYAIAVEGIKADGINKEPEKIIGDALLNIRRKVPAINVYFTKRIGHQVMIVQQSLTSSGMNIEPVVDQSLPPYTSIGGTVHLTFWSSHLSREYKDLFAFETYGLALWGSWSAYEAVMQDLKRVGYFFLPCADPLDLRMGVGVWTGDGVFMGSLTLSQRLEKNESIPMAREKMIEVALEEQQNLKQKW